MDTVKKSYSITSLFAPMTPKELMVDFLDYKTSVERLSRVLKQIGPKELYEAVLWRTIFAAERAVIKNLNNGFLNSALAWNRITQLPSHPSLIADLQKYVELRKPKGLKNALFQSFTDWALLGHQTIKCACGRGFKTRTIKVDLTLRTLLRLEDNALVMKQMVGVKTDDAAHLAHHYNYDPANKPTNGYVIVFESESEASAGNIPLIKNILRKSASQFNAEKFIKLMTSSLV